MSGGYRVSRVSERASCLPAFPNPSRVCEQSPALWAERAHPARRSPACAPAALAPPGWRRRPREGTQARRRRRTSPWRGEPWEIWENLSITASQGAIQAFPPWESVPVAPRAPPGVDAGQPCFWRSPMAARSLGESPVRRALCLRLTGKTPGERERVRVGVSRSWPRRVQISRSWRSGMLDAWSIPRLGPCT